MDNMTQLQKAFEDLMSQARKTLLPDHPYAEALAVKCRSGQLYAVFIPDFQDAAVREPLENKLIQLLVQSGEVAVEYCLATADGIHPEIPSWNFRSGLVAADTENLQTVTFLWGGDNIIYFKPIGALLPPEK